MKDEENIMKDGLFVFNNDLIVNVVVADPTGKWQPPESCWVMPVPEGCSAGIGWRYVDDQWISPPPQPVAINEIYDNNEVPE